MKMSGLNNNFQARLILIAIYLSAHAALAGPKLRFEVDEIPGYPGAINNHGVVVGDRDINDFGDIIGFDGTLIRDGVAIVLEAGGEFPTLYAKALNNRGEVVGAVIDGYVNGGNTVITRQHAALWSNGVVRALGPIGTDVATEASDINNAGVAVGSMYPVTLPWSNTFMAVMFRHGQTTPLGTLPGHTSSDAWAINDAGEVLCHSWSSETERRSFLVRAGSRIDLGALPGGIFVQASGLNNLGHVVGYSQDAQGLQRAFLYIDGAMHDLTEFIKPNTGWTFLGATAINDKGQIIGIGQINGGAHTTFLLTPKKEPTPRRFKSPHGVFPGPQ